MVFPVNSWTSSEFLVKSDGNPDFYESSLRHTVRKGDDLQGKHILILNLQMLKLKDRKIVLLQIESTEL